MASLTAQHAGLVALRVKQGTGHGRPKHKTAEAIGTGIPVRWLVR